MPIKVSSPLSVHIHVQVNYMLNFDIYTSHTQGKIEVWILKSTS